MNTHGPKRFRGLRRAILAPVILTIAGELSATEGGMGRPITAQQIMPYAGAIPEQPGISLASSMVYYNGDFGGNRALPLGGTVIANLNKEFVFNPITATLLWNKQAPGWNFASSITLPLMWQDVSADVQVAGRVFNRSQDKFGLYDIMLTPFIASFHSSKMEHLAMSFSVWVPSGDYSKDDLANLGLNVWTFVNSVSYTKLFPNDFEFSVSAALELYTENLDTRYENGALTRVELLLVKRTGGGLGFGVVGGTVWQIENDKGALADALGGFPGRSFGAGPILTKSWGINHQLLSFDVRWILEFDAKNRTEGDSVSVNASYKF